MYAKEIEPSRLQREIMESLGFQLVMTDETDGKNMGKSAWRKSFLVQDETMEVCVHLYPKDKPDMKQILDAIFYAGYHDGQKHLQEEIKGILNITSYEDDVPDR